MIKRAWRWYVAQGFVVALIAGQVAVTLSLLARVVGLT